MDKTREGGTLGIPLGRNWGMCGMWMETASRQKGPGVWAKCVRRKRELYLKQQDRTIIVTMLKGQVHLG